MSFPNILLTYHSKCPSSHVEQIEKFFNKQSLSEHVLKISENTPRSLRKRAEYVKWSSVVVVVASHEFQTTYTCMELAQYAYSIKLPVIVISFDGRTATGPLAAIGVDNNKVLQWPQDQARLGTMIISEECKAKPGKQPTDLPKPENEREASTLSNSKSGKRIVISALENGAPVVALIEEALKEAKFQSFCRLNSTAPDNKELVAGCSVFIFVMSPDVETNESAPSSKDLDHARLLGKMIIPVKGGKSFKPSAPWLALSIAGKIYFNMESRAAIYKPMFDSSIVKNFICAVTAGLSPPMPPEEVEKRKLKQLKDKLEEAKAESLKLKLPWPPEGNETATTSKTASRPSTASKVPASSSSRPATGTQAAKNSRPSTASKVSSAAAAPSKSTPSRAEPNSLKPDQLWPQEKPADDSLPYNYIHYSVTRVDIKPPPPLFDVNGNPIQRQFDAMLSYQWDNQSFVREVMEDLNMRNVTGWMDIWGGMQDNVVDSMARAVESSHVFVCFLSEAYQTSANCLLEFRYALHCQKPMVFLMQLANKQEKKGQLLVNSPPENWSPPPLPWIAEKMRSSLVIPLRSVADCGAPFNGVPRIQWVAEAIQKLIVQQKQLKRRRTGLENSTEVLTLEQQLDDALNAIHLAKGSKRFLKCTRCQLEYEEEHNRSGVKECRKHTAYYMGGTIMAGRWVCCGQTETTSPGCGPWTHTQVKLDFHNIPNYPGCKKWFPEEE